MCLLHERRQDRRCYDVQEIQLLKGVRLASELVTHRVDILLKDERIVLLEGLFDGRIQ